MPLGLDVGLGIDYLYGTTVESALAIALISLLRSSIELEPHDTLIVIHLAADLVQLLRGFQSPQAERNSVVRSAILIESDAPLFLTARKSLYVSRRHL